MEYGGCEGGERSEVSEFVSPLTHKPDKLQIILSVECMELR